MEHTFTRICRAHFESLAPVLHECTKELRAQKDLGLAVGIEEIRFYSLLAELYEDLLHGSGKAMRNLEILVTMQVEPARVLITVKALHGQAGMLKAQERRYELRGDMGAPMSGESRAAV